MLIKKYAAIDIGSNAIRLLITSAIEERNKETKFKKTSLIRVPIRLGADVFTLGLVSTDNYNRMLESMKAFKLLMNVHNVSNYRACATSAMREAKNGKEIIKSIKKKTGIDIEIIDGNEEAEIIALTNLKSYLVHDKTFLYVDVGGGSTELTIFSKGKSVLSKSFKIGTVRLINDLVSDRIWNQMKLWVKAHTKKHQQITLLGTGGNINSTYKFSGTKPGKPLSARYLKEYFNTVKSFSYEERISKLGMNSDRADVILPALKVYLSAMKWSGAKEVYVPKIGLSDGIIRSLHKDEYV